MNYKETTTSGTAWQRCSAVTIENPIEGQKTVTFREDSIVQFGDKLFVQSAGNLQVPVVVDTLIPVINPNTGEAVGSTITHADLYVLLYSAYLYHANQRDIANSTPSVLYNPPEEQI